MPWLMHSRIKKKKAQAGPDGGNGPQEGKDGESLGGHQQGWVHD